MKFRKTFSLLPGGNLKFEVLFFCISIAVIFFALMPVFSHGGWPQNHEGLSFAYRTEIYAQHLKHGDMLPIWSSSDAYGAGTPLPLFYHKTFYYISGFLYLVSGHMKIAIVISIAFFMLIGSYGMRFCIERLTKRRFLLAGVPVFILANYTFTDWLVRGAMAEFTAMMIIPWLLWWCLVLIIDKRFSYAIIPIMFILVYSHNITALFGIIPVLVAYISFLVRTKPAFRTFLRKDLKRPLGALIALLLLLLPGLLLEKFFLANYDPGKITQDGYLATANFQPVSNYFWNTGYVWLRDWREFTVQIDWGLWIPIAAILLFLILESIRSRGGKSHLHQMVTWPACQFIAICALIFLLLQMPFSKFVYSALPPLQFLQFPWRLLSYLTPLLILFIVYFVAGIKRQAVGKVLVALWILSFIVLAPAFRSFHYKFINSPQFNDPPPSVAANGGFEASLSGIGEYLPRTYKGGKQLGSLDTLKIYDNLYATDKLMNGNGCNIKESPVGQLEPSTLTFRITCPGQTRIALPVSYSNFMIVTDLTHGKRIQYSRFDLSDPRIILVMPKTSDTLLQVKLPSIPVVAQRLL